MCIVFMLFSCVFNIRDVEVMKKTPSKGQQPPCHTVKGRGLIHTSPEFVLKFILNPESSNKIDELLKEGVF